MATELLAVYFLFPDNVGGERKRAGVSRVLEWGGDVLPDPHIVTRAFSYGIGSGGQGYNTRRPFELMFLVDVALAWKQLPEPDKASKLEDPTAFEAFIDGIPEADGRQIRHIVLHLLFPDQYERIASGTHKARVVQMFRGLIPEGTEGEDSQMRMIQSCIANATAPGGRDDTLVR